MHNTRYRSNTVIVPKITQNPSTILSMVYTRGTANHRANKINDYLTYKAGYTLNKVATLHSWQTTMIPREEIIFNASECYIGQDGWVPFTIGAAVLFNVDKCAIGTHTRTLLCSISSGTDNKRRGDTNKNRSIYLNNLARNGFLNQILSPTKYCQTISDYKFVVSPEGNGIDCHRHYEALIAGCIPIIEKHAGIEEKYRGCPILWTEDYSEITEEYLAAKYAEMIDQVYDFSRLFLSSYPRGIQSAIRHNGNYWSNKILGYEWYHL